MELIQTRNSRRWKQVLTSKTLTFKKSLKEVTSSETSGLILDSMILPQGQTWLFTINVYCGSLKSGRIFLDSGIGYRAKSGNINTGMGVNITLTFLARDDGRNREVLARIWRSTSGSFKFNSQIIGVRLE